MRKITRLLLGVAWALLMVRPVSADIRLPVTTPGSFFRPSFFTLTDNQISIRLGKESAQVEACFHLISKPADTDWPGKKLEWAWPMPTDWATPRDFRAFSRIKVTKRDPEDVIRDYRTHPCQVPESFEISKDNPYYQFNTIDGVDNWFVFGKKLGDSFAGYRLSVEMRVTYTQPYNKVEQGGSEFQYILRTGSTFAGNIGHLHIDVETEPGVEILNSTWELQDGVIDTNEIEPEKDLQITLAVENNWKPFPVAECEELPGDFRTEDCPKLEYGIPGDPNTPIVFLPCEHSGHQQILEIIEPGGEFILEPTLISETWFKSWVYHSDLNRDGTQDFIVNTYLDSVFGDNQWFRVAFVLSVGETYKVTVMHAAWFDPEKHLIDLRNDGSCQVIHVFRVYGDETADGDVERFGVRNLFEFQGDKVVEANHLISDFPQWKTWNRDSSKDVVVLGNDEKKHRIWEKNKDRVFWEIEEEYKEFLQVYWGEVIGELFAVEKLEDPGERQERTRKILEEPYSRTHPATMLSEERAILDDPDHEYSRAKILESFEIFKEVDDEEDPLGYRRIINVEDPSEKDVLFLLRILRSGEQLGQLMTFLNAISFSH